MFLDYILSQMDHDNIILNTAGLKKNFNRTIKGKIHKNTLNKYFSEFTDMELMKRETKKGRYFVNPVMFAKATDPHDYEIHRDKLTRKYYELSMRPLINKTRHSILKGKDPDETC